MDNTTRYLNFVKKYNEALSKKGTNWLGSEEMGKVLLETAIENNSKNKPKPKKEENAEESL